MLVLVPFFCVQYRFLVRLCFRSLVCLPIRVCIRVRSGLHVGTPVRILHTQTHRHTDTQTHSVADTTRAKTTLYQVLREIISKLVSFLFVLIFGEGENSINNRRPYPWFLSGFCSRSDFAMFFLRSCEHLLFFPTFVHPATLTRLLKTLNKFL